LCEVGVNPCGTDKQPFVTKFMTLPFSISETPNSVALHLTEG
jgi:hypothetical protein